MRFIAAFFERRLKDDVSISKIIVALGMRLFSLFSKAGLILAVSGFMFISCNDDDVVPAAVQIEQYLSDNNITNELTTSSGLVYVIEEAGGSEKPNLSDEITINYQGYLIDGTIFDQTPGTPRTFPLSGLILSWQEGIPLIGRGGKIKLISPPELAYGDRGSGDDIKPGDVIVFDIELIDFN